MAEGSVQAPVPRLGVGALVIRDGKVLLIKRARPPKAGLWTLPGGKVEWGETLRAAAEREILEETGIRIRAGEPVHHFELIDRDESGTIRFHYVIVDLLADYLEGEAVAASDAAQVRWVGATEFNTLPVEQETRRLLTEQLDRLSG